MINQPSGSTNVIAIKSMQILYGKCPQGCQSCNDSLTCNQCKSKANFKLGEKCISQCKSNQYKSSSSCVNCHSSCKTCFGPNPDNCTSCAQQDYFVNPSFQCVYGCTDPSYTRNDKFGTCDSFDINSKTNKSKCSSKGSDNICTSCFAPYVLSETNCAISDEDCPYGQYYKVQTNTCIPIPTSNCLKYNGQKERCEICASPYKVSSDYSCKQEEIDNGVLNLVQKPTDFFKDDNTGIYIHCDSSCETCNSSTINSCLSCHQNGQIYGGQCQKKCNSHKYYSFETGFCEQCGSDCDSCVSSSSSNDCIECSQNMYKLGLSSCINSCPSGYYSNGQYNCNKCKSNCKICSSPWNCQTCENGYNLLNSNSCIQICPSSYYLDNINSKCISCIANCNICSDSSTCSKCNTGFILYNGNTCLNACPTQFYLDKQSNTCQPCLNNCDICQNATTCDKCSIVSGLQYYIQFSSGVVSVSCVQQCPPTSQVDNLSCKLIKCLTPNCAICDSDVNDICSNCSTPYLLQPNQQECYQTCPSSYYFENGVCTKCMDDCISCQNSQTCDNCDSSFVSLIQNGQAVKCIKQNSCLTMSMFYLDLGRNLCLPCQDVNCRQCLSSEQKCDVCDAQYFLQDGKCLSQCDLGYFVTSLNNSNTCNLCQSYINSCKHCNDQSNCIFCKYNHYKTSENLCVSQCPEGYSQNKITRECDPLNISNCIKYNLGQCIECKNQYLKIIDHECQLVCPSNFIPNYDANTCDQQGCTSQQFFYNLECLDTCPQNTIPNTDNKTCDLIQSKTFNLYQSDDKNTIILSFQKGFTTNIISLKQKIIIKLNILTDFTYTINQIDEQSYAIKIDLNNNSIDMQILKINLNDLQCEGSLGIYLVPHEQELSVYFKYQLKESDKKATQTVTEATSAITKSVIVGSFSLVFTRYFQILSTLVELTELIYLTIFLDIMQVLISQ